MAERLASPHPQRMKVSEAVKESRTSPRTIHRKIADGTLTAVRFGRVTLIDRASFDAAFEPVEPDTAA